MGNSNSGGRACGSFGGAYGATGYAPAAHDDGKDAHKFQVEVVFAPVAAVAEEKKEGKVVVEAVAGKAAEVRPHDKPAEVSVHKGAVKAGEILALLLESWDHALDKQEEDEKKKIGDETKALREAEEANNKKTGTEKKTAEALAAEHKISKASDWAGQRDALRKYKPGWVVVPEYTHKGKDKDNKEVDVKVAAAVTHDLELDLANAPNGTKLIFAFFEASEVPQGHKAPVKPAPAATAGAGASSSSTATTGAGAGAGASATASTPAAPASSGAAATPASS